MFRLIFILILFFCYSCNNKKTDSIDVNLINNPNTLEDPQKSKSQSPVMNFISKNHDFGLISEDIVKGIPSALKRLRRWKIY